MSIDEILNQNRIIPVLTIHQLGDAIPLCSALLDGGLTVLEITLRTPTALDAIEQIKGRFPEACLGVGTLLESSDFDRALNAGASFAVSPGLNMDLVKDANKAGISYLPGVQTNSEAMTAYRAGLRFLKFFPAKSAGGSDMLKQFYPLYPELMFCPTGGVKFHDAASYLSEPNVICIGGSFASPSEFVKNRDWQGISQLARQAAAL